MKCALRGVCKLLIWATALTARGATDSGTDAVVWRLQDAHRLLAAHRDPGAAVEGAEAVCRDLLSLVQSHRQGRLNYQQVLSSIVALEHAPAVEPPWPCFAGVWQPLYKNLDDLAEPERKFLGDLGVVPRASRAEDVFTFFTYLELLKPLTNGACFLVNSASNAYAHLWVDLYGSNAPSFRNEETANWIKGQIYWDGLSNIREENLTAASIYWILSRADVPPAAATQPLAAAFMNMVFDRASAYSNKWHWHGVMLDYMSRTMGQPDSTNAIAAVRFCEPYYLLICHGGIPVTSFRAWERNEDSTAARVYHFSAGFEEDIPSQAIFTRQSHLQQALALVGQLARAGIMDFDPVRHIFLMPFDVAEGDGPVVVRSRRFGYMGYLDAFGARRYPSILRPIRGGVEAP